MKHILLTLLVLFMFGCGSHFAEALQSTLPVQEPVQQSQQSQQASQSQPSQAAPQAASQATFSERVMVHLSPRAFGVPTLNQLLLVFLLSVIILLGACIVKWLRLDYRAHRATVRIRDEALHSQGLAPPDAKQIGRKTQRHHKD